MGRYLVLSGSGNIAYGHLGAEPMPFAFLMTDFLKRLEAGDPKALGLRDRVIRLFRVATLRKRAAHAEDKRSENSKQSRMN
jgi:hypothetical protein